jgi:hypothetical protein
VIKGGALTSDVSGTDPDVSGTDPDVSGTDPDVSGTDPDVSGTDDVPDTDVVPEPRVALLLQAVRPAATISIVNDRTNR